MATFIDVRTPGEFAAGHIPLAINIPLDQLSLRIGEFKDMRGPIITYCLSGNRSARAVVVLKGQGIGDVLDGGSMSELMERMV